MSSRRKGGNRRSCMTPHATFPLAIASCASSADARLRQWRHSCPKRIAPEQRAKAVVLGQPGAQGGSVFSTISSSALRLSISANCPCKISRSLLVTAVPFLGNKKGPTTDKEKGGDATHGRTPPPQPASPRSGQ